ncbi:13977_t:CDS:2 [Rhizophagus irregularis]|nr:13977_t:CDS:2 [Rhizophagus irregularis]
MSNYQQNMSEGNFSTRSLGGATAIGTPHVNPTENTDEVASVISYSQQHDEGESGSVLTRDSYHQPLVEKNTYDQQHYPDYNQASGLGGFFPQRKYIRQEDDPYYDEEATRHNTLTSGDPNVYGFEHDYTDRDFPGGGKGARQSMTGEYLTMPVVDPKKRKCCGCCTWPVCILITLIILIGLGITGFFVLPRIPKVNIKDATPASAPILKLMLQTVANSDSIATGTKTDYTLLPKRIDTVDFPLMVNYTSKSLTDPVIMNFINACSPEVTRHTPLKLKVDVLLFVAGIDWIYKPKISVPIPDINCPNI